MEKLGDNVVSSSSDIKQLNPQEARKLYIQRLTQSLVHANQCQGGNCSLPLCLKMKRVIQHTRICKRRTKGGCPICKQLISLCCHHGKHCQETKCSEPFCSIVKQKLKQQRVQQANVQRALQQLNPQEARKLYIQRLTQSLVHANQCQGGNCSLPLCLKMKRVIQHTRICKLKTKGGCKLCKQLNVLCCHHGIHCQETKCSEPFCSIVKQKLKQQRVQ